MKRILRELKVFELSAVDKPAQEGARALLLKRDDSLDTRGDDPGKVTDDKGAGTRGKREGDHDMTEAEKLAKAEADKAQADKDLAARDAEIVVLKAVAAMTDAEKKHYESLEADAAVAFVKMTPADRAKEVEKASAADAVVYTDRKGREYRKSDSAAVIALAKESDENAKRVEALEKSAASGEYTKRAETELPSLAGDVAVKAAVLKAIDGIEDKEIKDKGLAMLKAADAAAKKATETLGTSAGGGDAGAGVEAQDKLDKMAKDYQKANEGVSYEKAYDSVIQTEEGRKLYSETLGVKAA